MNKPAVRFALALLVTLASAVWQRRSGPTYPARGRVAVGGSSVDLKLTRTHGGPGDQPVRVAAPDPAFTGVVAFRRYPTSDEWTILPMAREGADLVAALPHQPPAGKLEYQVRLAKGTETAVFPPRPAVTRFKGDVPTGILVPHVLCMVLAMFFSAAAGLAALAGAPTRRLALVTIGLIAVGGFILGPIVQKMAFDAYWTGVPFGWDLTDNKTLIAGLFWAGAILVQRPGRPARIEIMAAAVTTLLVFAIPHSTWGSEIKWEAVKKAA
ncbi:MAG TPA: hypothetical protein PLB01_03780 [Thermoanaerobaculia bacterium]|nr:hypothetical protein [Thermoanaerobaculia bacterium]